MTTEIKTRKFTVDEYEKMVETGVLTERDNVELINGDIVEMTPIGKRHAACVNRLNRIWTNEFGDQVIVSVQNPVRIGPDSEPEPDLSILRTKEDFYASGHPRPEEILLLVEVMESSRGIDREIKQPMYARAGVRELWLVDLDENRIEQHLNPTGQEYTDVRILEPGDTISPAEFPDSGFRVNRILPTD